MVSSVSSIMASFDQSSAKEAKKRESLSQFIRTHKISQDLSRKMNKYVGTIPRVPSTVSTRHTRHYRLDSRINTTYSSV